MKKAKDADLEESEEEISEEPKESEDSEEESEETEDLEESEEGTEEERPRRSFNRGGGGFRGRGGFNRGSFGPREMHKATCTSCGKQCEVPFKPTPGKDVFCQDCFRKRRRY